MGNYHPASGYGRSGPRFGCILILLFVGLLAGAGIFWWSQQADDVTVEEDDPVAAAETAAARMDGTQENPGSGTSQPGDTSGDIPTSVAADSQETTTTDSATPIPAPNLGVDLATGRRIIFPHAGTVGRIVTAQRIPGGWDITYLQDLVGHLEGTPWIGEGNTVLAGHFEDQIGNPGPFRYLYEAEVGDRIMVQDGEDAPMEIYQVTEVFTTEPDDIEVLRNTDTPRLTLITCDDWNQNRQTYDERRVVIAEPLTSVTTAPSTDGVN